MQYKWNCDPFGPHLFDPKKILFFEEDLLIALKGGLTMPKTFAISPSDYCNQKCHYCVSDRLRGNKCLLDINKMISVLSDISSLGSKSVIFVGGGEPLANPYTVEGIIHSKNKGMDVGLITNGVLLKEAIIQSLLEYCDFIRVSIDTTDPTSYIARRGATKSQLQMVLSNLTRLIEYRNKSDTKIVIGTQIVWDYQGRQEIEKTIKTLKSLNVDYVQIRPVDIVPNKKYIPDWSVYNEYEKFLSTMVKKYSDDHFRVILSIWKFEDVMSYESNHGRTYQGCFGGNFACAIGADLKVYYCCSHIGNPDYVIGDLKKIPLSEVLTSEKRISMINTKEYKDCQAVCRNHEINKLVDKIKGTPPTEWREVIRAMKPTKQPMHLNFL
jgi:GTP 3',8-cyclase